MQLAPEGVANLRRVSEEVFGYLAHIRETDGKFDGKGLREVQWDNALRDALKKLTEYRSDVGATLGIDLLTEAAKFVDYCLTYTNDSVLTVGKVLLDNSHGNGFILLRDKMRASNCNVLFLDPNYERGQVGEHAANAEHAFPYATTKLVNIVPVVPSSAFSRHKFPQVDFLDLVPSLDEKVTTASADTPGRSYHPASTNILELTWRGQPVLQTAEDLFAETPPMQRAGVDECEAEPHSFTSRKPTVASSAGIRAAGGRDAHVRLLVRVKPPEDLDRDFIAATQAFFAAFWFQLAERHNSATSVRFS